MKRPFIMMKTRQMWQPFIQDDQLSRSTRNNADASLQKGNVPSEYNRNTPFKIYPVVRKHSFRRHRLNANLASPGYRAAPC